AVLVLVDDVRRNLAVDDLLEDGHGRRITHAARRSQARPSQSATKIASQDVTVIHYCIAIVCFQQWRDARLRGSHPARGDVSRGLATPLSPPFLKFPLNFHILEKNPAENMRTCSRAGTAPWGLSQALAFMEDVEGPLLITCALPASSSRVIALNTSVGLWRGEVSEWLKELASKASIRLKPYREFESL